MSLFDRLDSYYQSKKPSEIWLMVILVGILIGYLLYSALEPLSTSYRQKQEGIHRDLTVKIESAKSFLRSIRVNGDQDYYIKDLNRKIVQKRMQLNKKREELAKLDGAITQLHSLLYTKNNWSKFLHTITQEAKKSNLKLFEINNQVYDSNKTFGKVLDVEVKCAGEYGDILSFMNNLEQTELVANISSVTLRAATEQPAADINLSVWGITP